MTRDEIIKGLQKFAAKQQASEKKFTCSKCGGHYYATKKGEGICSGCANRNPCFKR